MAKTESKKAARKILVEFEMNPEDVKKLIQSGKKGPKKLLGDAEFDKLIKVGAIKASDYLDPVQMEEASRGIGSWIRKVGGKIKKAISNPTVQTTVVTIVAGKLTSREMEKELELDNEEEDKPKD
jgi:hypothetical protein